MYYCNQVVLSNESGYYYRANPKSITRGYKEEQSQKTERMYRELIKYVKTLQINDPNFYRVKRCLVAKIRNLLFMIVRSNLSISAKIQKMDLLLSSSWCREILEDFDISKYRLSLKITTYCMIHRWYILLYIILFIKEFMTK
ncbi:hypothetical protein P261_01240 [Lachnospiraceae bacterium TWA4]|nr:hypothetical protein P261_01240 [Lachnospiraceae bacterium TWA4]